MTAEPIAEPMKEIFNELFSHLERLEAQSEAILQFLKEKKRVTDKQLAPYLEQAGNASNVRWRAARVRIERLLSAMEDKGDETKIGKAPEIAMAEQAEKKQDSDKPQEQDATDQHGKGQNLQQLAKEQVGKNQVASPELDAAVHRNTKQEPEQKKTGEKQPPERQIATSEKKEDGSLQKPAEAKHEEAHQEEANHPTEMTQEAVERASGKPSDEMKPKDVTKDGKEAA